jgi:hypothetical protein
LSFTAFELSLYTWFKRESGVDIIDVHQAENRPLRPYGTLHAHAASSRVGARDDLRISGSTFTEAGQRFRRVELKIFGNKALENASAVAILEKVRDSLEREDVIEELDTAGISINTISEIQHTTELEESRYMEQAVLELEAGFSVEGPAGAVPIEHVEVNGQRI